MHNKYTSILSNLLLFVLVSCNMDAQKQRILENQNEKLKISNISKSYFKNDSNLINKVDSIYNTLSPKERAAQMIMYASSSAPKLGYPFSKAYQLYKNKEVGNILFLKGEMEQFKNEVLQFKKLDNNLNPLYACDCEPSLMNGKWSGSTPVLKANVQKTLTQIAENTSILNKDMKSVGVQLNFAPVVDRAINKEVISNRAFSSNTDSIILLSNAFIQYSQKDSIATSIKHFPGHGNVKGDSHKESVYIDGELSELPVFKSIIQNPEPPLTVMVGHIAVKNNPKYGTDGMPATISRTIVTDLLRKELNYEGVITTDAMNMVAAAKVKDADWRAVVAGVDLVLMPKNPAELNKKIVQALKENNELSCQIEASIKRVIRLKCVLNIL